MVEISKPKASNPDFLVVSDEVGDIQLWVGGDEFLPVVFPHTPVGESNKFSMEVRFFVTENATHQYFIHEFPSAMGSTYSTTRMRIKEEE